MVLNDEDHGPEISHGLNSFLHGLPEFRRTALGDSSQRSDTASCKKQQKEGRDAAGGFGPQAEVSGHWNANGMKRLNLSHRRRQIFRVQVKWPGGRYGTVPGVARRRQSGNSGVEGKNRSVQSRNRD